LYLERRRGYLIKGVFKANPVRSRAGVVGMDFTRP
jgi:hypothetical protein